METTAARSGENNSPIHSKLWLNIKPKLPIDKSNSGRPIDGHTNLIKMVYYSDVSINN